MPTPYTKLVSSSPTHSLESKALHFWKSRVIHVLICARPALLYVSPAFGPDQHSPWEQTNQIIHYEDGAKMQFCGSPVFLKVRLCKVMSWQLMYRAWRQGDTHKKNDWTKWETLVNPMGVYGKLRYQFKWLISGQKFRDLLLCFDKEDKRSWLVIFLKDGRGNVWRHSLSLFLPFLDKSNFDYCSFLRQYKVFSTHSRSRSRLSRYMINHQWFLIWTLLQTWIWPH